MHIALINNLYTPYFVGGAEISVQLLAETVAALPGHQVSVITLCRTEEEEGRETINGVNVYRLALVNSCWPFGQENALHKKIAMHVIDIRNFMMERKLHVILKKLQPDLVHTNNLAGFSVGAWTACKRLRLPIVHTLRDFHLMCYRSSMFKKGESCVKKCPDCALFSHYRRHVSRFVDHVVGISQFLLDKHLKDEYFKEATPHTIYNAVDIKRISDRQKQTDNFSYGFLGRLSPEKGIDFLIDAFIAANLQSSVCLKIAGTGKENYQQYLLDKSKAASNIHFLGHVDPKDFLADVDVLIVPSLWDEPFGRVIIEAFASGVPVIASHAGGIPELITEGKEGFIFSTQDQGQLTRLLERIYKAPDLHAMKKFSVQKSKHFTSEIMIDKYLSVYSSIVNR